MSIYNKRIARSRSSTTSARKNQEIYTWEAAKDADDNTATEEDREDKDEEEDVRRAAESMDPGDVAGRNRTRVADDATALNAGGTSA